ncbi:MAG: sulfatase-like hydrolase/transferase [Crocinitomicaceae bacterium]
MRDIFQKIPAYIRALFLFMGIALLNLAITKAIFYFANSASFIHISWMDIFASLWFDIITVALIFIVFVPLWLIPFKKRNNLIYRSFFRLLFFVINSLSIALNLIDVIYFEYTSKRSTADLFSMVGYGQDMNQLWTSFLRDFWWLAIIFILLIIFSDWLFRKVMNRLIIHEKNSSYKVQIIALFCIVPLVVLTGRGGVGLKPVSMINAAQYTRPENAAFLMNTTFTMLKSLDNQSLEEKTYFTDDQLANIFSAKRKITPNPAYQLPNKTNVVIVILESFGDEWVGKNANGVSFTPFLDSIFTESYYFDNAISNGKKSIEGIPAILSGIPTLMDNPYISSNYSGNKIIGLGNVMKKHDYSTYFYHGATNGSMNFDGFTALTGIEHYVGRKEYNNDKDNDGTWGIYDHKFLPWAAQQMSKTTEPFCSAIFTLSSHHPYKVPEEFEGKLMKGPVPLCQSINYTDLSLRMFFDEAKKQPWFNNTVFVFVADHTSASKSKIYGQRIGMYEIPIAFYSPTKQLKPTVDKRVIQQIDIYPTLIDLLGWNETIYSIGSSVFDFSQPRFAVNYLEGTYQLFQDNYVLTYTGKEQKHLFNFKTDLLMKADSINYLTKKSVKMEQLLKGIIQTYNNDLIYNRTIAK